MDDTKSNSSAYERSDEEVSWDAEFANIDERKGSGYPAMLGDVAKLVVQVPVALVRMPMEMLPDETARHARAAVREGFLAVRSLVGAIGDGIENLLAEPSGKTTTVAGPPGTWGTGRHGNTPGATGATPPGKARRVEVSDEASDEVSERSGGEGRPGITIDELGDQEGRGLRADIDY